MWKEEELIRKFKDINSLIQYDLMNISAAIVNEECAY